MKSLFMFSLFVGSACAGVNLRNGNFYISYTDIVVGNLEITRTYNSKSVGSTEMGFGWGYEYADALQFPADGVTLRNHGLGLTTYLRFQGTGGMIKRSDYAAALIAAGNCATVGEAENLLSRLVADRQDRDAFLSRGFSVSNDVHPLFSGGIALESRYTCADPNCKGIHGGYALFAQDRVVKGGWSDGGTAQFSREGLLLELSDGKDPSRKVVRDGSGKIALIQQGSDHIRFFYDENGKLCRLVGSNGLETEIQIDSAGNLVYTRDTGANEYWYAYDDNHNLTRIGYDADDPSNEMRITYVESGICGSVRHPSGLRFEYRYGNDPTRPESHFWTETTEIPPFSPPVEGRHEFSIGLGAGGVPQTEKIISMVDGVTTSTPYDSAGNPGDADSDASAPLRKVKDGDFIREAEGPLHRHLLKYDAEGKFLSELETTEIASGRKTRWTYSHGLAGGRQMVVSVTDGQRLLEFSTDQGMTTLMMGGRKALVGNGGRVSMDGKTWYGIEFRRQAKDGPLLASLTGADGKPAEIPDLEAVLNTCRLPLGVCARQFLPPPLHEVRWYSFDL